MPKYKLRRFAENKTFENVFEPALAEVREQKSPFAGKWNEHFGNDNPITLELGCGKGEYTLGLARMYPDRNFIGVDIKGARIWRGAKTAKEEGLTNVAFLRTRIEFIERFFEKGEVAELWLTFSDPQPKDEKGKRKLTAPVFIERYRRIMKDAAPVHIKTDSPILYDWTMEVLPQENYNIEIHSDDVYGKLCHEIDEEFKEVLNIKTFYERRWLKEGAFIRYIRVRL
jgi:tRNA (guanine-N7-)-methyltransferase